MTLQLRHFLPGALFFLLTIPLIIAQPPERALPESVGLSSERLARIGDIWEQYIDDGRLPGGTLLLARKGKIVYFETFGHRDLASKTPYRKDDIFRIASMTKAFTTVATLILYEQGKFRLDDPLWWYLPEFKSVEVLESFNKADSSYTTVPAERPITIRHLLTHTSGSAYGFMDPRLSAIQAKMKIPGLGLSHESLTTKEMVKIFTSQPLMHQPGENWTYGHSTDILGYLVEVLSGESLGVFCRQNIFEPLGMKDTYFYLPPDKLERLVPVYGDDPEEGLQKYPADAFTYPGWQRKDHFAGGGGSSSTTEDFAIFCQMLLNKGHYNGTRILGRKTVELMTTDQLEKMGITPQGMLGNYGTSFCLGFAIYTKLNTAHISCSEGAYNWGGAFNTKFWIDPKEEMVMVSMTQVLPFRHPEFWEKLNTLIYSAVMD